MIMKNFLVGDVVQLKSGGQNMTVTKEIDAMGKVECVWFSLNGARSVHVFSEYVLQVIKRTFIKSIKEIKHEDDDIPF
jgi:uncharacterized protein YodC (DUF2158 family)